MHLPPTASGALSSTGSRQTDAAHNGCERGAKGRFGTRQEQETESKLAVGRVNTGAEGTSRVHASSALDQKGPTRRQGLRDEAPPLAPSPAHALPACLRGMWRRSGSSSPFGLPPAIRFANATELGCNCRWPILPSDVARSARPGGRSPNQEATKCQPEAT